MIRSGHNETRHVLRDLMHHSLDSGTAQTGGTADGKHRQRQFAIAPQVFAVVVYVLVEGTIEFEPARIAPGTE